MYIEFVHTTTTDPCPASPFGVYGFWVDEMNPHHDTVLCPANQSDESGIIRIAQVRVRISVVKM